MNNDPILSICLPTYNQPNSVRAFFESIIKQLTSDIEIIIRDDSSNNETESIVKEYTNRLPISVRYFKGEKSKTGGYDKALLFLTEEARGKYIWWYGDDIMANDAVARVISYIRKYPTLSFIWLNSQNIINEKDLGLNLGGDKFFKNGSEIFEINVGLLGFPSATILKREDAIKGISEAKKFIGTTLTGYYLVLYVISQDKEACFVQKACLLSYSKPPGEVRWYDSFEVHAINYCIIAQEFRDKFNHKSFRRGLADQFGRIWRAVIVERALGLKTGFANYSPKIWKMTRLYWSYPEFWIAFPLFLVPRPLLRVLYKAYKFVRR